MLIKWHGHSEFTLECADGFTLLTDPFDAHTGYPMLNTRADAVTVSHGHGDHSEKSKALGTPAFIESEGKWQLAPDKTVTAIASFHDDAGGAKRGNNLIMKIEMDGLVVVHMGDIGTALTAEQRAAIGTPDILMLPVGGFFTVDAAAAAQMVSELAPRIVIPMHYKTRFNADWPIADEKEFAALMRERKPVTVPLLRVTAQDLSEQPRMAVFEI